VLDDFSRYILAWKLCTTMAASAASDTLQVALQASDLDQVKVLHRPLERVQRAWRVAREQRHQTHPQPSSPPDDAGQNERYHRSMKNRILLENYHLPGQLEQRSGELLAYYNNCRYHESLDNLTPSDVYSGKGRPYSNVGKPSNERPSNKDAACTSGLSQLEPSNPMSQMLSKNRPTKSEMF
jgi:putative transposase